MIRLTAKYFNTTFVHTPPYLKFLPIKYDSNYDGTYDEKLKHAPTILTSGKFLCSRYIQNKNSNWLERCLKYLKIKLKSQFREIYLYEVESHVPYELLKYYDTIQSQFVGYNFQYRYVQRFFVRLKFYAVVLLRICAHLYFFRIFRYYEVLKKIFSARGSLKTRPNLVAPDRNRE